MVGGAGTTMGGRGGTATRSRVGPAGRGANGEGTVTGRGVAAGCVGDGDDAAGVGGAVGAGVATGVGGDGVGAAVGGDGIGPGVGGAGVGAGVGEAGAAVGGWGSGSGSGSDGAVGADVGVGSGLGSGHGGAGVGPGTGVGTGVGRCGGRQRMNRMQPSACTAVIGTAGWPLDAAAAASAASSGMVKSARRPVPLRGRARRRPGILSITTRAGGHERCPHPTGPSPL